MPSSKLRAEVGPPPKASNPYTAQKPGAPPTGPRKFNPQQQQWIAGVVGGLVDRHASPPEEVRVPRMPKKVAGKKALKPVLTKQTLPVEVSVSWGADCEHSEGETDAPDAPPVALATLPAHYGAIVAPMLPREGPRWCPAAKPLHGSIWFLMFVHVGLSVAGIISLASTHPNVFSVVHAITTVCCLVAFSLGSHRNLFGPLTRRADFWILLLHILACAILSAVILLSDFHLPESGPVPLTDSGVSSVCVVVAISSFAAHGAFFLAASDLMASTRMKRAMEIMLLAAMMIAVLVKLSDTFFPTHNGTPTLSATHLGTLLAFFYCFCFIMTSCLKAIFTLLTGSSFTILGFNARWVHIQPEKAPAQDDASSTFVNIETLEPGSPQAEAKKDPHLDKYSNFVYDEVWETTAEVSALESPMTDGSLMSTNGYNWPPSLPGSKDLPRGPYNVVVGCSLIDKRGVFANRAFARGEVVEVCPFLLLKGKEVRGAFKDYTFEGEEEGTEMFILGYGSLYNSSTNPNLDINYNVNVFWLTTNVDIEEGEELYIDYGPSWFKERGYDYKVNE